MAISSLLNVSRDALMSYQGAIQITGSNIANVSNADYTRQRAVLTASSRLSSGEAGLQTSVSLSGVDRIYDRFIERCVNGNVTTRTSRVIRMIAIDSRNIPSTKISAIITIGTRTIQPPMYAMTSKNKIANGKSTSAVSVALVRNIRIASKSFRLLANDPTDLGCDAILRSITFSKIIEDIIMSLFLPALSKSIARVNFKKVSRT